MALTEKGHVFSWGENTFNQLGRCKRNNSPLPGILDLSDNIPIKKIVCGRAYSILLSREGDIYFFGNNNRAHTEQNDLSMIGFKFNDIAAHFEHYLSAAVSEECIYYIWGEFNEEKMKAPKETTFESFQQIFANYFQITYKEIHRLDECLNSLKQFKKDKYNSKFEEINFISSGNFGIVCRALNKETKKLYAIKRIPFSKDQEERVFKETKVIAKLWPKYVVQCFDFWVEKNYFLNNNSKSDLRLNSSHGVFNPYNSSLLHIQMEMCFKTMKEIILNLNTDSIQNMSVIKTPFGYYIASELSIELFECVNYMHKQNPPIIHRDLKPANILITYGKNGRFVKLADFGLATTHTVEGESHTKYTGTRIYTAPEVMHSKHYDTKADIYSLGIIIQELFDIDINQ
jgi:hypothetical protein